MWHDNDKNQRHSFSSRDRRSTREYRPSSRPVLSVLSLLMLVW